MCAKIIILFIHFVFQITSIESKNETTIAGHMGETDSNNTEFETTVNPLDMVINVTDDITNIDSSLNITEVDISNETTTDSEEEYLTTEQPLLSTTPPTQPYLDVNDNEGAITGDYCLCDLTVNSCDVNCCCDEDCSQDDRLVFSQCKEQPQTVLDERYCFQQQIVYSNNTEYKVEVHPNGVFCILTDNNPHRTVYETIKGVNTLEEYEKLENNNKRYTWQPNYMYLEEMNYEPYQAGSVIWNVDDNENFYPMFIPVWVIGLECEATSNLEYLKDTKSSCSRYLIDLENNCNTMAYLSQSSYTSFKVVVNPDRFLPDKIHINETLSNLEKGNETLDYETTRFPDNDNEDSFSLYSDQLIPITTFLCINENETEVCMEHTIHEPEYSNGTCNNIVSSVKYIFIHNGTEGISEVHARIHLDNITGNEAWMKQYFETEFIWLEIEDKSEVFIRSGRPGYITGKPIILGHLKENETDTGEKLLAIEVSLDPNQWLSVLSPDHDRTCSGRNIVTFREEVRSGCVIQVPVIDLVNQCDELQFRIMNHLLGPVLSEVVHGLLRIASFGDSSVNNVADWVQILYPEDIVSPPLSGNILGDMKCSGMILSLHIEVAFAYQGSLANPQGKVVGLQLKYGSPQDISYQCIGLSCLNDSLDKQMLSLELVSSVSFVDVTLPSEPLYSQPPSLDVKLPHDFFYPFLPSSGCHVESLYSLKLLIFVLLCIVNILC